MWETLRAAHGMSWPWARQMVSDPICCDPICCICCLPFVVCCNPATGTGALTDQYLKDRAAMLSWKMKYDVGAEDVDDEALRKEAA